MKATQEKTFHAWCLLMQKKICTALEALEQQFQTPCTFQTKEWLRPGGGGGQMTLLEGNLFEKAGVNVSCVHGTLSDTFRQKIPGCEQSSTFWAAGLSLVIHPRSPHVPIIHMNVRHIRTQKQWFGGGIDLTPVFPDAEDTKAFHHGLQKTCDAFDKTYYPTFKAAADQYFWLAHRNESRGVGGIFYDNLTKPFDDGFAFTQAIGELFLALYTPLVQKNWRKPVIPQDRSAQLIKRGRYVEFNLLYDRGTRFGLETDGNIDAILMSLPPLAAWPSALETN